MPSELISIKSGTTSNCYCTQDEADDYFDNQHGAEEWAELDSDTKDRLILSAAKQINKLKTKLDKLVKTQSMNFPVDDPDDDGYSQAKEANILQALFIFQTFDAENEARIGSIQGLRSEGIGPVSKSITGFNPFRTLHPSLLSLLAPYLDLVTKLRRG